MEESKLVTIEEVCDSDSSNISQNKLIDVDGDYPIYGASGFIKKVNFYHQEKPYLSIVKDGSGYGRITLMPEKTSVIGTLQYLLPKDNVILNYLYYAMLSIDFKKYVSGAAIPHIYFRDYKKEEILLRPLEEQQKIVEKLDKAFELIDQAKANIERNIQNAKDLFQSKLNEVFSHNGDGWMVVTLKDICYKITDGSHNPPKGLAISKFIMLSSKNIIDDKITFDNPRYISEQDYFTENKRTNVEENDVLLTIVGTIGRVAVVPKMDNYFTLQRSVAVLKPNLEVLKSSFLKYTLQAKLEYLESNARGVAQKGIYLNQLKNIEIAIPSIIEQNLIVDKLDLLQNESKILLGKYQQKLSNLEELRKSILEKAFKGELTN